MTYFLEPQISTEYSGNNSEPEILSQKSKYLE